ncbi:MAG TPA: isoprenylcysteine carboxylmethyltransferase family protein [Candidatus Krumholzibacteria bacterium]|nr:isoprenylcysteine carboxylmethyltransferase family protein [Candidatus Krumholzibacteria bacterium]
MHAGYAYGRWGLVVTMAVIVLFFLLRLVPMKTRLGKRSGGALIAFVTALFAEMYGFPLTIYLLGHFLGVRIPLDHINGHLLGDLLTYAGLGNGWVIVMVVSNLLLVAGVWIISSGWDAVYHAQGGLVTSGFYSHVRHPQYSGIFLLTIGFMIQWPTLATLILWPFVIVMYRRLAKQEEKDALAEFGDEYRRYMATTPMFIPRIHRTRHAGAAAS